MVMLAAEKHTCRQIARAHLHDIVLIPFLNADLSILKYTLEADAVFLFSINEIANLRVHVQHSRAHL